MTAASRPVRRTVLALGAVLALSACGSGGEADAGTRVPVEGALAVTGTDGLKFDPTSLAAEAGEVTVELRCERAVAHDFVIEEIDDTVAGCNGGGADAGTVQLEAGEYTYYCSLPGHRSAGMEGTLTVS